MFKIPLKFYYVLDKRGTLVYLKSVPPAQVPKSRPEGTGHGGDTQA